MNNILAKIKKNNLFPRIVSLFVGSFVLTFIYNKFLVANHIVVGGVSGLAILVQELSGISTTMFINISNVILVILSFLILGKRKTIDQLIGCIVYIVMLNVTAPLAENWDFTFSSPMLMLIIVSIVYGVSCGFIYRAGYSTGGSDFLAEILSLKLKKPMPQVSLVIQVVVIVASVFVFGVYKVMMAVFIIFVSNKITNAVLFGVSTKKMVYVISEKNEELEDFIMNKIKIGATEIKVRSGLFGENRQMILCVVHNTQYAKFKSTILELDPKAFMMAHKCYEVSGGTKYEILPF